MDYQQPTVSSLQKVEANHDVRDTHWPLIAGNENGASSFSFATTRWDPFVHADSGCTDDSTSYNPAANLRERFDQPVAVSSCYASSSPFTATPRQPFEPLDPHFLTSFEANNAVDRVAITRPQAQHLSGQVSVHRRPSSSMSVFSFKQPPQESRYYPQALSIEEKLALAQGEKDHNLQEWSGKNLITHHEARRNLVPRVMPKAEKTNALASIEHDKQHSQRALSKITEKVRKVFGRLCIKFTIDTEKDDESAHAQSPCASQPTYDLRFSTLSPAKLPPLPESTSAPSSQEFVDNSPHYHATHARTASSEDYFSQPPYPRTGIYYARRISPLASTSGAPSSSNSSIRARSPLAQEVQFRTNPETTFDSLLAPHKSGKGEVLKDSKYAQKVKTPKAGPSPSPKSKAKTRRLTKMP